MTVEKNTHQFSKLAEEIIGDLRGLPPEDPAKSKKRPTRDLTDLLQELIAKHHIGQSSTEQVIREHWPQIVGAANATYSHAAHLERDGRQLIVIASHAVVRNELFLHRLEIIERLKKLPGCSLIKDLRLRAG